VFRCAGCYGERYSECGVGLNAIDLPNPYEKVDNHSILVEKYSDKNLPAFLFHLFLHSQKTRQLFYTGK
jgi:hypothetical protein